VRSGHETLTHYFLCPGGTGMDSTKSVRGHVTLNVCFGIWWDLQVTYYIPMCPGHETLTHYFYARARPVWIRQKCARTRYAERVFWHPVGSAGHVVHFSASRPRNVDALFLCSDMTCTDSTKGAPRHVMLNLGFCIRRDLCDM
jgi:hypothetical protein